jgi:hypothetical protein
MKVGRIVRRLDNVEMFYHWQLANQLSLEGHLISSDGISGLGLRARYNGVATIERHSCINYRHSTSGGRFPGHFKRTDGRIVLTESLPQID